MLAATFVGINISPAGAAEWSNTWVQGGSYVYNVSFGNYGDPDGDGCGTEQIVIDQFWFGGPMRQGGYFNSWIDHCHVNGWAVYGGNYWTGQDAVLHLCRPTPGSAIFRPTNNIDPWVMYTPPGYIGSSGWYQHGWAEFRAEAPGLTFNFADSRCFGVWMT